MDDGCLVRADKGAGDLVTSDEFGSFELQLEYRISPAGNSGSMFHVTEDSEKPWHSGPEVQIIDNAKGKDPQHAGWLYQLYRPLNAGWARQMEQAAGLSPPEVVDATRPAGEWNHLYLRVAPGGGSRNDPFGHGQRLDVLFGKILRIDVDRRGKGLAYASPSDNPFVGREGARGEIHALGLRNPWQLARDPPTGRPTSTMAIPGSGLPIFGFGEDADGELYVCTSSLTGQGVFKLVPAAAVK